MLSLPRISVAQINILPVMSVFFKNIARLVLGASLLCLFLGTVAFAGYGSYSAIDYYDDVSGYYYTSFKRL